MALAELVDTLRNTTLDDGALLFSPHAHAQWSDLELKPIPHFLFRVYTPRSDGFTDKERASSRDATSEEHEGNEDIFATQTPEATAKLIADHLWWRRHDRRDNLVSWSSSMLFLIRYIFHRHYDSNDGSSLHDIRLLVVDTEKLPARTFIRDSDLISAFERFDAREKYSLKLMARMRAKDDYYFGEYLSQGSLCISGKCSTVSAQTMINKGLLDLHLVFRQACEGKDSRQWVKPVQNVRSTIRAAPTNPPAALELLDKAFEIALEFGEDWRLPIAVHLLALLPYGLDPSRIHERLWNRLTPTEHEVIRGAIFWQTIHAPPSMPELMRGKSIMRKLFVMHVQYILLRVKNLLAGTIPILPEYSSKYLVVADIFERTADTLRVAHRWLELEK